MTAPKIVVERATFALTRRCAFRKLFLTPFAPMLHLALGYLLARAAELTGVVVHHIVVMPNHIHLVVSTTLEANLPDFKRLFFGEASKLVKVALAEHGFEPPERTFSEGTGHQERLVNAAAQLALLHYQDVNPVDAGLVERVVDYPGLSTDPGLMSGVELRFERPGLYCDPRTCAEEHVLRIAAPDALLRAYGSARPVIHRLRRLREVREAALRRARTRPVVGAAALARLHPWSEPRSPRRFDPGPKATFVVVGDPELAERCAEESEDFQSRYRSSRQERLEGKGTVFPYGTYQLRVDHGVAVEPVEQTAGRVLTAPGAQPVAPGPSSTTLSDEQRRKLHGELGREAGTPDEEVLADNLARRLERAEGDHVDRTEAPNVSAPEHSPGPGEPGSKVVVLRSSTATARRRRRREQERRRRAAPADDADPRAHDPSDVEPPFD